MELRFNSNATITTDENGDMVVEGYVNKTNQESRMLGSKTKFVERISKGAWTNAITRAKEIHFLAEHDKDKILASTRNGSLELREDEEGLYMKATISPTSWGKDYYQLIKDGILQNMSFGFRSIKDKWKNAGTHYERIVSELDLFEVSVVRDPAYSSSQISARGIDLVEEEVPEDITNNIISIDVRSAEDIDRLAEVLIEKLKLQLKVVEPEVVEEDVDEEPETEPEATEPVEPEKVEETEPEADEPVEDEDPETEPTADEDTQEKQTKEEELEVVDSPTDKIRDFIKQFK